MGEASRYPIGAVSKLTGLSVDTLRMWERRYKVVVPERDGRGRLYSEDDVRRLQLLADAVTQGHSIGRLSKLDNRAVGALLEGVGPRRAAPAPPAALRDTTPPPIDGLRRAVAAFDASALESELGRLAIAMPAREFVHRVVLPVMTWVGEEWHAERLSVGQEHLLSASLRNLLGGMTRQAQNIRGTERLLFATPSGDRHEFGILAAAMLAAAAGLGVVYLGADLPGAQIVDAAVRGRVQVVVLGHVYHDIRAQSDRELRQVAEHLPAAVELWVGGTIGARLSDIRPQAVVLPDFAALEAHLVRVGGRL